MTGPPTPPRRWVPWAVLAISLGLTCAAVAFVAHSGKVAAEMRFQRDARGDLGIVQRRLEVYVALLRATAAVMSAEPDVTRDEFREYVARLELSKHYPGIQGLGWSQRVDASGVPAFQASVRAEGLPQFEVWPRNPPRDTWFAIRYLEPLDRRNIAALGYDMHTEPTRRAAMDRAMRTGQPAASGKVTLVQEIDPAKQPGVLIYVPVYRGGDLPGTEHLREELLTGFAYGAFRTGDLFAGVFPGEHRPSIVLAVYDGEATAENLLAATGAMDQPTEHIGQSTLEIAGRSWTVVYRATPEADVAPTPLLAAVITGGLLISLVLFGVVLSQQAAQEAAIRGAAELAASEAALRESEERFRSLIEQSPLGMRIFAADGRLLLANRAWEERWGLPQARPGEYNVLEDPFLKQKGVEPLLRDAFAGVPAALPPLSWPVKGDEALWTRVFAWPVRGARGVVREVVLVYEDVSGQVRAEEALRQTQKLESIGVLAGGVAHDFNNLLTGILGYANLAARKLPTTHPAQPLLEHVLSAGARAADLTRQLLAYAGKGRYFVQCIDVAETIREIGALVHASVPRKVEIAMDLGDEPLPVMADGSQIQQLVMNLVINGAEAIGDRGGHVEVRARRVDLDEETLRVRFPAAELRPGAYVEIQVRDDGVGMDAETLARIFDPFFTTKFMGRGLGLAAALGIVRGHQGGISVQSAAGAGTTFTIVLPVAEGVIAADEEPSATGLRGSETVLVVDDEPVVREAARQALQEQGYRVLVASDGPEALEVFDAHAEEIDVVLLDFAMPGLSGAEVHERMVRRRPAVAFVMTSGFGEEEALRRMSGRRIQSFLQKPWTVNRLGRAIRAALAARGSTQGIVPPGPPPPG
jgi:two-component system cell cycle sensor histidine kinase/response regulator CckA